MLTHGTALVLLTAALVVGLGGAAQAQSVRPATTNTPPAPKVAPATRPSSDPLTDRLAGQGSEHFLQGRYGQALQAFRDAEAALTKPPADALLAELRYRQGRALYALQRYDEAAQVLRSALQLRRPLGHAGTLAETLHALADALAAGDAPAAARSVYEEALHQRRAAHDTAGAVRTQINLAQLHTALGHWGQAVHQLDDALAEATRAAALPPPDRARLLSSIGVVRALLGQQDAARQAFRDAALAYAQAGDVVGRAECLRNEAFIEIERGAFERARQLYLHAVEVLPIDRRAERARGLNGAGFSLVRMQRGAEALPLLTQAQAALRDAGPRLELARTLESLGGARLLLGEFDLARRHYAEGLSIARHLQSPDDERELLFSLAKLALAQGQTAAAIVQLKLAVNISQQLRAGAATLDPRGRGALVRRLAEPYQLLARLLIEQGRLAEGEGVLLALKDAETQEFTRGSEVGSTEPVPLTPDEREALAQINALGERLDRLYRELQSQGEPSAALREKEAPLQDGLAQALASLDERLAARHALALAPALDKLRLADKVATLSAHALGEASLMLMYVPGERVTTVLMVGRFGARPLQLPVGLVTLAPLIDALRAAILDKGDHLPAARALHRLLVEPVERELASIGQTPELWMLFLTDRLRYLPFAALVDGAGRHLVEKVRLAMLTSTALDQLEKEPRAWSVHAFGSTQAAPAYHLNALPAARAEVLGIVRSADNPGGILPGVGLLDAQFTRDAWWSAFQRVGLPAPPVTVLHVASHFKALPGDWNGSFLLLGGGEELRVSELRTAPGLSLSHLDLVTLSACATEINDQSTGQELEGFGALLQKRGARAVIGTLWAVQDQGTAVLMRRFYAARGEHRLMSKARALQQAQLALLRGDERAAPLDLRHPYYWAPFVLMGNWL